MKKQQKKPIKKDEIKKDKNTKKINFKKIKDKIVDFLNKSTSIIVVLVILDIVMLMYIVSFTRSNGIRVGYYQDDEISIANVHYFINGQNNYFYSSNIAYTGEEVTVYNYIMGYYVEDRNGKLIPLLTRTNTIENGVDLATLLAINTYSYSETASEREVFTKDVLKNIDNLHFVVRATTKAEEQTYRVNIDKKIDITKVIGN